jgi:flagellar hook-associated protein 1 FlgK
MSMTSALNSATSGLSVTARLADTISNNVANALTEGYGRRTTEVTSLTIGGYGSGARVAATTRAESAYLTGTRRTADSAVGATEVRSSAYDRMMAAMGEAGADNAVSTLATGLETALMAATASPQSTAKLADAVEAASALAAALNRVSEENVALRSEAVA